MSDPIQPQGTPEADDQAARLERADRAFRARLLALFGTEEGQFVVNGIRAKLRADEPRFSISGPIDVERGLIRDGIAQVFHRIDIELAKARAEAREIHP